MKEKIAKILNIEINPAFKLLSALSYIFVIGYLLYVLYLSWEFSSYICEPFKLDWIKILNNPLTSFLTILTDIFISFLVTFGLYGAYAKIVKYGQRRKTAEGIVLYIIIGISIIAFYLIYKVGCVWQAVLLLISPKLAIFLLSLFLFYIYYNIIFRIRYPYGDWQNNKNTK